MINVSLIRSNTENEDYKFLTKKLDAELRLRFGDEQDKYDRLNVFKESYSAVVAMVDGKPVASGAWREFDHDFIEIKRMYVIPGFRKKGIAGMVLNELESWAQEEGFKGSVLECGTEQPEAIALYLKHHYAETDKYGEYKYLPLSICFRKLF